MKNKKILGAILIAALVAFMAIGYFAFSEKPVDGEKSITIQVVSVGGTETLYEINTDASYLIEAMQHTEGLTFLGEEGPYGMSISHINSVRADYTLDGAYWAFYVNGDYCNYGISEQPVEDGDAFSIVYTPAIP